MHPSLRGEVGMIERRSLDCGRNSSENTHPATTVNHSLVLQGERGCDMALAAIKVLSVGCSGDLFR